MLPEQPVHDMYVAWTPPQVRLYHNTPVRGHFS